MEDGRIALTRWLAESVSGRALWEAERAFFRDFLLKNKMERLLLAGCAPDADWAAAGGGRVWRQGAAAGADVQAACGEMPWQNGLFDGVFLIHDTDFVADLAVSLAEAHRVTRPYGYAVLTGFNPHSLWRWGQAAGWVRAAPPLARVKAAAVAAGWQVAGGAVFGVSAARLGAAFAFFGGGGRPLVAAGGGGLCVGFAQKTFGFASECGLGGGGSGFDGSVGGGEGWGVSSLTCAAVFSARICICRVENPCKVSNLAQIFALHLRIFA